jgi:integrase
VLAGKAGTAREILGHKDVRTTMIYTHVLNRAQRVVRSGRRAPTRDRDPAAWLALSPRA